MAGILQTFRCPSTDCRVTCRKDNIHIHLTRSHKASICKRNPEGNTISWQFNLNPDIPDSFFLCEVPRWGLFFAREMRLRDNDGISSRIYVQYLGLAEKANHFQYELKWKISETKSMTHTGNVEHLFVPFFAVKNFFILNRPETTTPEDYTNTSFTITIRKKTTQSGTII